MADASSLKAGQISVVCTIEGFSAASATFICTTRVHELMPGPSSHNLKKIYLTFMGIKFGTETTDRR